MGMPGSTLALQKEVDGAIIAEALNSARGGSRGDETTARDARMVGSAYAGAGAGAAVNHSSFTRRAHSVRYPDALGAATAASPVDVTIAPIRDYESDVSRIDNVGIVLLAFAGSTFITAGAVLSSVLVLATIAGEKHRKLVGAMRAVGLFESTYWASWLTAFLPILAVAAGIASLVGNATNIAMFTRTSAGIHFIALLLLGTSSAAMALCCASLVRAQRSINVIAFLLFAASAIITAIFSVLNLYSFIYQPIAGSLIAWVVAPWPAFHYGKLWYTIFFAVYFGGDSPSSGNVTTASPYHHLESALKRDSPHTLYTRGGRFPDSIDGARGNKAATPFDAASPHWVLTNGSDRRSAQQHAAASSSAFDSVKMASQDDSVHGPTSSGGGVDDEFPYDIELPVHGGADMRSPVQPHPRSPLAVFLESPPSQWCAEIVRAVRATAHAIRRGNAAAVAAAARAARTSPRLGAGPGLSPGNFNWTTLRTRPTPTSVVGADGLPVEWADFAPDFNLWMMTALTAFYLLAAWYFAHVATGDLGAAQPFYFPLLPSFWGGACAGGRRREVEAGDTLAAVQELSASEGSVRVHKISKTYKGSGTAALKEVSLVMPPGQVTALLGACGIVFRPRH